MVSEGPRDTLEGTENVDFIQKIDIFGLKWLKIDQKRLILPGEN